MGKMGKIGVDDGLGIDDINLYGNDFDLDMVRDYELGKNGGIKI